MELTFDEFLTIRVGLGMHQYISFIILSMIKFISGFVEIFVLTLIRILANEWSLSESEQMKLGSIFYAGVMIGNFLCSLLADISGRRTMLIISQSLTLLTIVANSYAASFHQVLAIFLMYGLMFGIYLPICQVLICEIVPINSRGRSIVLLQLIYIFGVLYLTGCCYIFLDSFSSGDWRGLLRVNSVPALISLSGTILFLRESPRLYIAQGKYRIGFMELNHMGVRNKKNYMPITGDEQKAIIHWRENSLKSQMDKKSFAGLFKGNNLKITLIIWAIFINFTFIASGIQIITPYILENSKNGIITFFIFYGAELPAITTVILLIDNEKYGGRTRLTIIGLLLQIIVQLSVWYFEKPFIVPGLILQRFSIRVVWSCVNALLTEGYSTVYRSMGVGAAQGIGRGAASISPFPILWLYYQDVYLPFIVCSIMSMITLFFVMIYPINSTLKPLDRTLSIKLGVSSEIFTQIPDDDIDNLNCKQQDF